MDPCKNVIIRTVLLTGAYLQFTVVTTFMCSEPSHLKDVRDGNEKIYF